MFIAHLPSGYILSQYILKQFKSVATTPLVLIVGAIGAIAPDFDMAYFYLIDHQQTHHHKYISHWPILWFSLVFAFSLGFCFAKQSKLVFLALVFSLGGVLHIVLDSFVGDIWWFAPFIDKPYALFSVPARFQPWWLNFIIHWSFIMELIICAWAWLIYRNDSNKTPKTIS